MNDATPTEPALPGSATDPEVETVLRAVPEFAPRYLELVEAVDGDPGAAAAFGELADFAAELALGVERFRPVLARAMAGVEQVARSSNEAEELVGWAFLDSLSPDDLRRLDPWIGPATRAVLDAMELGLPAPPSVPGRAEGRPGGRPSVNPALERHRALRAAPGGTRPGWSLGG